MLEPMIPLVGLVTAGALSPGPNNIVVMHTAARAGAGAVIRAILGVVAGTLCLVLIADLGGGWLFATFPSLQAVVAISGASYLGLLGARTLHAAAAGNDAPLPSARLFPLAVFQFLNPKAWVLALTAVSQRPTGSRALLALLLVFLVVPTLSLLVWAVAGAALRSVGLSAAARRRLDRIFGVLLVASAILLVVEVAR